MLSPESPSYLGDVATRATNRATKLREPSRTGSASKRLNKPDALAHTSSRRYRTQEVAGSSPASSIRRSPAYRDESEQGRSVVALDTLFDTVTLEVKALPDRVYAFFGPGADYMRPGLPVPSSAILTSNRREVLDSGPPQLQEERDARGGCP